MGWRIFSIADTHYSDCFCGFQYFLQVLIRDLIRCRQRLQTLRNFFKIGRQTHSETGPSWSRKNLDLPFMLLYDVEADI